MPRGARSVIEVTEGNNGSRARDGQGAALVALVALARSVWSSVEVATVASGPADGAALAVGNEHLHRERRASRRRSRLGRSERG